ncbi:CopG family transcriptional regulator [Shewanella amazonensis]|uniref:Transcriptional regulator, CopG family n=1 Tax=Shewanella amazonensis (strain ATCC BAA-1098 / SB2B) TaxID=326297 RepID=A1S872_SHEAM|nr:CopG family transcriptional regulator [Shewanella amazonensis]ABM00579.1 transcriptional regulator, CopG family [Shewanella amazonensis SB2B]
MGLADLKKNSTPSNNRLALAASIEDFIEGANLYAMGLPQQRGAVISLDNHRLRQGAVKPQAKKRRPNFRKATFTLSEPAIAHLAEMASDCDVAKSKLVRFLIEHHYQLTTEERQHIERALAVD